MKVLTNMQRLKPQLRLICSDGLHSLNNSNHPTHRCLTKHLYSKAQSPAAPPSAGFTFIPSRQLISLSGPDSTKYLQGVITANLASKSSQTSGFYAAFLNAQGRLLNDVFIYPQLEKSEVVGWYVEVDSREAQRLAKHIKRYKLRARFDVRMVAKEELRVWSVWDGGQDGWTAHSLPSHRTTNQGCETGCEDKRAPGMGRRLLLPRDRKPEVDMDETTEDSYRIRRYLRGVPEGQDELIREHALPQESNIDLMGGIDYRKGCYVGQELTIRTHHTGVVRKRILPIMIYDVGEPIPQKLEYLPETRMDGGCIPTETSFSRHQKRGRTTGKWLNGVGNLGLGLCRLGVMTDFQVQGESEGYTDSDQFKLEWEADGHPKTVMAKAIVPPCSLLHHSK